MNNIRLKLRLTVLVILCALSLQAQVSPFLLQGRIEFEKKVNLHAQMDEALKGEQEYSRYESIKKSTSQFQVTYFDYSFAGNTSLYKPGRENPENKNPFMGEAPASANVVYSKLDSMQSVSQKKVFEQLFLVKDSIRPIHWKITDETRKIAGFDCRRANAIIMDSVYVVAFYTDAIVTPGGPESFAGLPGMILGVALPHEHTSWFATKVLVDDIKEGTLLPPTKGKAVNNKAMRESLNKTIGKWGGFGPLYLRSISL